MFDRFNKTETPQLTEQLFDKIDHIKERLKNEAVIKDKRLFTNIQIKQGKITELLIREHLIKHSLKHLF